MTQLHVYAALGSSPLARGLRICGSYPAAPARIIPARAGFTPYQNRTFHKGKDHPRSRGVYELWGPDKPAILGSSPLARGLHLRVAIDD